MTVSTPVSKQEVFLLSFAFVDDADLVSGANDVHTIYTTMIAHLQALTTCWNDNIRATCSLIAPEKT